MTAPVIINGQQRQGRARPLEILDKMGPDLYRRAYEDGMSFSAWLEFQDPSTEYTDRMDAFHRLLHAARIRPRARGAIGLPASDFDAFLRTEQTRALIPEQFRRWWREVQTGQSADTRAIYTSSDDIPGSTLRPVAYAAALRTVDLIVPPFSLAETDFDSAATGKTITNKVWWSFKLKFAVDGFMLTHIIGSEADITKLGLLNVGDSNQQVYLADPTSPSTTGTLRDGVVYGISADVPTDTYVGLDSRRAMERVTEIGSNIEEIERFARNQTQVVTMSENEAFSVLQPGATKTLLLET
jgi:hypothetical protein